MRGPRFSMRRNIATCSCMPTPLSRTDALPKCLDGLMEVIRLSVMLDTTQDADEYHTAIH